MPKEYEKFERNPKKEERRRNASPRLESKRFHLSDNPEVKKRIEDISKVQEEMKQEHPEIVSFGLFGSTVKGYAIEDSDVDLYVYIDHKCLKGIKGYPNNHFQARDFETDYLKFIH